MTTPRRRLAFALVSLGLLWVLALPSVALASGVRAKFDLSSPAGARFRATASRWTTRVTSPVSA